MELARQQHDAHQAKEGDGDPSAAVKTLCEDALDFRVRSARSRNPLKPPNTEKVTNRPTVRKAASLTIDRRHRHDQPFLMLGGVDVARAEQNGKDGHRDGDDKGGIGGQMQLLQWSRPSSASTEMATALSWRARYGRVPATAMTVTMAATAWLLP